MQNLAARRFFPFSSLENDILLKVITFLLLRVTIFLLLRVTIFLLLRVTISGKDKDGRGFHDRHPFGIDGLHSRPAF